MVLISVVGTLVSDNLTDNLGVPLETTTVVFAVLLVAVLRRLVRERADALHPLHPHGPPRGVLLAAILFTFALGTSAGDLTAERMDLGYWVSAVLFAALIAAVAVAHYALGLDAVLVVLDRVHPHPPARRLARRLSLPGAR